MTGCLTEMSCGLQRGAESCYGQGMANSYLGIVSRRGLELLTVENEHTAVFLARRCRRAGGTRVCCWATLDVADAEAICDLVRLGMPEAAWRQLNLVAVDGGRLLPPDANTDAA